MDVGLLDFIANNQRPHRHAGQHPVFKNLRGKTIVYMRTAKVHEITQGEGKVTY